MPFTLNWDEFETKQEFEIKNIEGWKDLTIEFAYAQFGYFDKDLCWHIKGTDHTFTISIRELTKVSESMESYIRDFLAGFRKELIEWIKAIAAGEADEWMEEYFKIYKDYLKK